MSPLFQIPLFFSVKGLCSVLTTTPGAGYRTVWGAPCAAEAGNANQHTVTLSANASCTVRLWSNDRIFADGVEDVPPL